MKILLPILLCFAMLSCARKDAPDAIYTNAHIWTGDKAQPAAEALAIKDGIITAIGSKEKIVKMAGDATQIVDLQGAFVTPAFTDNHVHFLQGGAQLASINLRTAKTQAEFIQIMKSYATSFAEGGWISGGDWDHEAWGGELPRRQWIDSVTANVPVFVSRLDGHMALANSKTLALAKIDRSTPDPVGGSIVRDEKTGEPTGVLKDEAMNLVWSIMPEPTADEFDKMFERAQAHALSVGVGQVHDMGSYGGWNDLDTYRRAEAAGRLKMRIYSFVPLATWKRLSDFVQKNGWGNDLLRWGGLKGFVDGSLGSTTAWFYKPYADEPNTAGFTVTDTLDLQKWILAADSAGLHIAVHAIGDRANDWLLDVFQLAEKQNGSRDRRFRIEHAQHLSRSAVARFAQLKTIPSMQPYHCADDGRWAQKRIGPERILTTYAFRSLLDAGAPLTFGSDWTVAPLSPLDGIWAAVTRQTLDGANPGGWVPQEKITVEEALHCYTSGNAYAGFFEKKSGELSVGKLADFTVLAENLLEVAPDKIKNVKVLRTLVGGVELFKQD